jgi:hypothetical protein
MCMHEEHERFTDLTKAKARDYTCNHLYVEEPGHGHCPFLDEKQTPSNLWAPFRFWVMSPVGVGFGLAP